MPYVHDRIEIQKGHCLAVAPITSEISPPGFGRRKAGFSHLPFNRYDQYGEHYKKREKFVGLHLNPPFRGLSDRPFDSAYMQYSTGTYVAQVLPSPRIANIQNLCYTLEELRLESLHAIAQSGIPPSTLSQWAYLPPHKG